MNLFKVENLYSFTTVSNIIIINNNFYHSCVNYNKLKAHFGHDIGIKTVWCPIWLKAINGSVLMIKRVLLIKYYIIISND